MYQLTVGLETHCELSTKTKIFCDCTTQFSGEPNTHCCPICTGQPGSLPVLNREVVDYAIRAGLAMNCKIHCVSRMDRKHYMYPDLTKGYQISQFDYPICYDGWVELSSGRIIRINRIHIEEDAGKLVHNGIETLIDYNRAGIPLIEIVTEPDFHDPEEVVEYLEWVQMTMRYINVSRCRTKEGSIRCDINISVAPDYSETLGVRTEVKNLNSFSAAYSAVHYEYVRQRELLEHGKPVIQETLGFDESVGRTFSQREKENADDYRYFPDPDVLPIVVSEAHVESLRAELPELPQRKVQRYMVEYGLTKKDALQLAKHKPIADYFELACKIANDYKMVASMVITHLFQVYCTDDEREDFFGVHEGRELGELICLLHSGKINSTVSKHLYLTMLTQHQTLKEAIRSIEIQSISDDQLHELCMTAIKSNPKAISDYKRGKTKALQSLIGAVMHATQGQADVNKTTQFLTQIVNEIE